MALRKLMSWDDPTFRKSSRSVETFDERLMRRNFMQISGNLIDKKINSDTSVDEV